MMTDFLRELIHEILVKFKISELVNSYDSKKIDDYLCNHRYSIGYDMDCT